MQLYSETYLSVWKVTSDDGRDLLVQTDHCWPELAEALGWIPSVEETEWSHHISLAGKYLNDNEETWITVSEEGVDWFERFYAKELYENL